MLMLMISCALLGLQHQMQLWDVVHEGRALLHGLSTRRDQSHHALVEVRLEDTRFLSNFNCARGLPRDRPSRMLMNELASFTMLKVQQQHTELQMGMVLQEPPLPVMDLHLRPVDVHPLAMECARR